MRRGFFTTAVVLGFLVLALRGAVTYADSFPADANVADWMDGTRGFVMLGFESFSGAAAAGVGDVNADGFADAIVGSPFGHIAESGESFVVFGSASGIPATLPLDSLDGTNGFELHGIGVKDFSGGSVSSAGDVNGDGIDDIFIGAHNADFGEVQGVGEAYIVFGSSTGFPVTLELSSLDGTDGFTIYGTDSQDNCGFSVSRAGDVNGDQIDDILLSAHRADPGGRDEAGESYVVFGSAQPFPAAIFVSDLDGTNGFTMNGVDAGDRSGIWVSGAGDVNGDGFDDVAIGAARPDEPNDASANETYIVYGTDQGFPATLELSTLNGTNGCVLTTDDAFDASGAILSDAGDINGDGLSDLVIGAANAQPAGNASAGAAFVLFGRQGGFPASVNLSALDGTDGFTIPGISTGDRVGTSVGAAGDVNGDGLDDLLVGSFFGDPGDASDIGAVYVVCGSASAYPAVLDPATLDGGDGFTLYGESPPGGIGSVRGAGDMNGDGVDDFIVSSPFANMGLSATYLVYGRRTCTVGTTNLAGGVLVDALLLESSSGGFDRTVQATANDEVRIRLERQSDTGNGKFVLHAHEGKPGFATRSVLPFQIGTSCFPFLLSEGAAPVIVANNLGRTGRVGASSFYGQPVPNPPRASTELDLPQLPAGTVLTFQALLFDDGTVSPRGLSTTNAVILEILP